MAKKNTAVGARGCCTRLNAINSIEPLHNVGQLDRLAVNGDGVDSGNRFASDLLAICVKLFVRKGHEKSQRSGVQPLHWLWED